MENINTEASGGPIATPQPSVPGTWQVPVILCGRSPPALPQTKELLAACPELNTHGAGVVMPADEQIVVAAKNPRTVLHRLPYNIVGKALRSIKSCGILILPVALSPAYVVKKNHD